jgi:hypothetical protein
MLPLIVGGPTPAAGTAPEADIVDMPGAKADDDDGASASKEAEAARA